MDQRVSLVTLGVSDLTRARTFYERLGWRGQEVEETVFFQAGGMALVLWGRDKLAADAGVADPADGGSSGGSSGGFGGGSSGGFGGFTLAQNVRSRGEVDEVLRAAAGAGARITRPAQETFYGGYAGCFTDPDGHVWEIAHNPGLPLGDDGTISIPDFAG